MDVRHWGDEDFCPRRSHIGRYVFGFRLQRLQVNLESFATFQYVRARMNHFRINQVRKVLGHLSGDQQFGPRFEIGLNIHTKL